MIGIDIIDLEEAKNKSNWQRPRFLEKLFTPQEQLYIQDSEDPSIMVWRLWSMKEAAYKLYTQIHPERFYKPKQFQCHVNASNLKVTYKTFECIVKTKTTSAYILSEALVLNQKTTLKVIKLGSQDYKTQSKTTKQALIGAITHGLHLFDAKLRIVKSSFGIPSLSNDKQITRG